MADLFGVDVSSYQGSIDWNKVKGAGVDFAILKIIRKDLNPDKQFETNWKGCENAGLEIQGVYNYSYATTVAKAQSDAMRVVSVLHGRKTMVWLDVEDACQKNLGSLLISIINAYKEVITKAGLLFGVYTGASFYKTYIKPYGQLTCPLWIASYGTNNGKIQENKRPTESNCIGWQYSSKGKVSGIAGDVDVNTFFGAVEETAKPLVAKPVIKKGVKGTQALLLQKDLNYLGFKGKNGEPLAEDGNIGANSDYAIREYQKANKLAVDGSYGSKSYAKMKELI